MIEFVNNETAPFAAENRPARFGAHLRSTAGTLYLHLVCGLLHRRLGSPWVDRFIYGAGLFPRSHLRETTRFGYRMQLDLHDQIGRMIYFLGSHEPLETERVRDLIRPDWVVMIVGAQIGFYTLLAARRIDPQQGHVYAIEPNPSALDHLRHHVWLNDVPHVTVVPEAVGDDRHASAANEFRAWVYGECVKNKKVFASATSEPGIGAHVSALQTTYERVDEGFIVNGVKSWVSMAGYADYYVVAAKAARSKSKKAAVSFLIVDPDSEGVSMKNVWDVLGMRSTSTNPVTMKDVLVPNSRLFLASEGLALYKVAREPHWLVGGYVGVYLGVMQAIFDFVVDYMKNKTKAGTDIKMSQDPVIQHQIGELYSKLQSARLATYHGAHLVDTARGTDEANAAIHHSKYLVSEGGPEMASMAIRMCGATALSRKLPIERLYRDSRCGSLMPAYTDDCLNYLGKAAFGTNLKNPNETYW